MRRILTGLASTLVALSGVSAADAVSFVVTAENPRVQTTTSTFSYSGTESFGSRTTTGTGGTTGFTSSFGTNGSIQGAYSNVGILAANQYGGAGGTGKYAVAWNSTAPSTSYSIDLSTANAQGLNYFGLWISAADSGNLIQFYSSSTLLYSFSAAEALRTFANSPNAAAYYGNPNNINDGTRSGQAFTFLNFYATDGIFNKIVLSESEAQSGFESDNHTVGRYTAMSGTQFASGGTPAPVPEPASWTMMILGFGAIGFALRAQRRQPGAIMLG